MSANEKDELIEKLRKENDQLKKENEELQDGVKQLKDKKKELEQELKRPNKAYAEAVRKGVVLFGHENFIKFMRGLQKW